MIWASPLTCSTYQNVLKKGCQKEDQSKLERKVWFWTEMHLSLRQLLIYTSSFIYGLFNPKVYGRVFEKSCYQFISKCDTFWHKFHCHIRFNELHLFEYSIYFFEILERGLGEAFIQGKLNYHKYLFTIYLK